MQELTNHSNGRLLPVLQGTQFVYCATKRNCFTVEQGEVRSTVCVGIRKKIATRVRQNHTETGLKILHLQDFAGWSGTKYKNCRQELLRNMFLAGMRQKNLKNSTQTCTSVLQASPETDLFRRIRLLFVANRVSDSTRQLASW